MSSGTTAAERRCGAVVSVAAVSPPPPPPSPHDAASTGTGGGIRGMLDGPTVPRGGMTLTGLKGAARGHGTVKPPL